MEKRIEDSSEVRLERELSPWVEALDETLIYDGVPTIDRPMLIVLRLLSEGILQVRSGDEAVDMSKPSGHAGEEWFRILFSAVHRWYVRAYGVEAMRGVGTPPLRGAVLIRGAVYELRVPSNRRRVEVEGEQTWIYFEDCVGEGEEAANWLNAAPDLSKMNSERRASTEIAALEVATALRQIYFHRMGVKEEPIERGFATGARDHLEKAAEKLASGTPDELGPAWWDLQMAAESALKLIIQTRTGDYEPTHNLKTLLDEAIKHGVYFDPKRLASWPAQKIIKLRYRHAHPGTIIEIYAAYRMVLDLVATAMRTIETPFKSGAGFLIQRPPWLKEST